MGHLKKVLTISLAVSDRHDTLKRMVHLKKGLYRVGYRKKRSLKDGSSKKVSKGWVIEWWQFAGTTDLLTGLARNSNLPLDTSNNTKRSDRRQIAMRQVFLLLRWKRNQMCIWNLQGEGCWACCTLYIELSTHALTLRSIITIKKLFYNTDENKKKFFAKNIARIGRVF